MSDWSAVLDAIQLTLSGDHTMGGEALRRCWENTAAGDHAQRCVIAHYLADLEPNVADELTWDERALAEFAHIDDADLAPIGVPSAAGFAPSLHLNVADASRRLGRPEEAHEHLAAGEAAFEHLGQDGYAQLIREGFERLRRRLDVPESA